MHYVLLSFLSLFSFIFIFLFTMVFFFVFYLLTFLTLKLLILSFRPATSFLICLMVIFCSTIIFSFSFSSSSVFSLNNDCTSLIHYLLSFSQGRDNVKMFSKYLFSLSLFVYLFSFSTSLAIRFTLSKRLTLFTITYSIFNK